MNRHQLISTNNTNHGPANQALTVAMLQVMGPTRKRDVMSEIDRRIVNTELNELLGLEHTENQSFELSAVLGSNNTLGIGAIECSVVGWGIWSLADNGYEIATAHLRQHDNFGFDSIEEFIEVLDLYSTPFGVTVPEPPYEPLKETALESLRQPNKEFVSLKPDQDGLLRKVINKIDNFISWLSVKLTGV